MKIIFVTGGVISGLGKGITSASIGKILQSAGYKVNMVKMDPYLQIDAGTMSPYEHGEVFVTEDGGETDLDIGNYERFLGIKFYKDNNITTGKVYLDVITRERKGDYLGKTVQIVPHITDNIKERLKYIASFSDITIVEVGGTVGDIESLPFLEAIRQMKKDLGDDNIAYVHLAPLLHLSYSGETKTKPIQHSVTKLREYGIFPNILVCRTETSMSREIKNKISCLCDISEENIIESVNVETIYEIPLIFKKQCLEKILEKKLKLKKKKADLDRWEELTKNIILPKYDISIGIVGKYTNFKDTYLSLIESLIHSGANQNCKVNITWISSEDLEKEDDVKNYFTILKDSGKLDGIIVPGGFGERGVEGKIQAIKFARENNLPFLGLCLGLQLSVIEFFRNVGNLKGANSVEFDENTKYPVIDLMIAQRGVKNKGGTMRLGNYDAILKKGSLVNKLYSQEKIGERHRHRFEVNPKYHNQIEKLGMVISGKSPDGKLLEFIENPSNKFFVATQAHPEFKSSLENSHPLFDGLVRVSLKNKKI
ncbi:CTP synthetase [Candidatus Gracilibacteria bacterium]|nr:MAG: CTP synthetase [Candidatus Gracilibacteria bacterium]PIE85102.1 MAG: CTP synthetase [Candidatus Gracilibacteria bacterium]